MTGSNRDLIIPLSVIEDTDGSRTSIRNIPKLVSPAHAGLLRRSRRTSNKRTVGVSAIVAFCFTSHIAGVIRLRVVGRVVRAIEGIMIAALELRVVSGAVVAIITIFMVVTEGGHQTRSRDADR